MRLRARKRTWIFTKLTIYVFNISVGNQYVTWYIRGNICVLTPFCAAFMTNISRICGFLFYIPLAASIPIFAFFVQKYVKEWKCSDVIKFQSSLMVQY